MKQRSGCPFARWERTLHCRTVTNKLSVAFFLSRTYVVERTGHTREAENWRRLLAGVCASYRYHVFCCFFLRFIIPLQGCWSLCCDSGIDFGSRINVTTAAPTAPTITVTDRRVRRYQVGFGVRSTFWQPLYQPLCINCSLGFFNRCDLATDINHCMHRLFFTICSLTGLGHGIFVHRVNSPF